MIYSLQGKIAELSPTHAVIHVGGVGYYLGISLLTSQKLALNTDAFLYTQHIVREDAQLLYGFYSLLEKEMFNLLLSVNGVGAVSALILLSSLDLSQISSAIASGNSAVLQKAKGIGAKTAQRIVVDLRDKVQKFEDPCEQSISVLDNKVKQEALSALEVLGISRKTAEKTCDAILKVNPSVSVEELVKQILKNS